MVAVLAPSSEERVDKRRYRGTLGQNQEPAEQEHRQDDRQEKKLLARSEKSVQFANE
jgi:hypothetical protein